MSQELITYNGDRRLTLANGEAARSPIWVASWNKFRVGLQGSFHGTAAISGSPEWVLGFGAGSTDLWASGTSTHIIGIRNTDTDFAFTAAPDRYTINPHFRAFKRVGTTVTDATSFGASNHIHSAEGSVRTGIFLEVTKGSPNYTFRICVPTNAPADLSDAKFDEAMQVADISDIPAIAGLGSSYTSPASQTLAVDEGVDGTLTHLFVFWSRTAQQFSFNIKHRKIS